MKLRYLKKESNHPLRDFVHYIEDESGDKVAEVGGPNIGRSIITRFNAHDDLVRALKDAERIISTALRERQFSTETAAQRQNKFDAEGHIGGIHAALSKATGGAQ